MRKLSNRNNNFVDVRQDFPSKDNLWCRRLLKRDDFDLILGTIHHDVADMFWTRLQHPSLCPSGPKQRRSDHDGLIAQGRLTQHIVGAFGDVHRF